MSLVALPLLLSAATLVNSPPAAAAPVSAGTQAEPKTPKPKPSTPGKGGGKPTPAATAQPTTAPTTAPTMAPTRTASAAPTRAAPTGAATTAATSRPATRPAPVVRLTTSATPTPAPAPAGPTPSVTAPTPDSREDDSTARRTFAQVGESLAVATRDPQLPLGVLLAVVVFVLVQNRIDRRDPKLATARTTAPTDLEFSPPVRRSDPPRPRRRAPRPLLRIVVPDAHHSSPSALPGEL